MPSVHATGHERPLTLVADHHAERVIERAIFLEGTDARLIANPIQNVEGREPNQHDWNLACGGLVPGDLPGSAQRVIRRQHHEQIDAELPAIARVFKRLTLR